MANDRNYEVFAPEHGVPIKAWTRGVPVEDEAKQQLLNIATLPFIYRWIAVMPDVHLGKGGTLGTGNHFIEVCLDESQNVWIVLHSGSRGVGNRIGQFFIELAKKDMRQFMINLPDQDLAYLPEGTEHFNDYVKAVHWAQSYAMTNRELMMAQILDAVRPANLLPPLSPDAEVAHGH